MNSCHLLDTYAQKEARNNGTYENDFTDIDQMSNRVCRVSKHRVAKRPPITNRNLLFINDYNNNLNTANDISNQSNTINSGHKFHCKQFDTNYVTCSRSVQYNLVCKPPEMRRIQSSLLRENNLSKTKTRPKTCVDKETYCRPVYNYYNQEFVYRTMSRDARLQQLLSKIVYARQREKQHEKWNNFINQLKTKHRCAENEHKNTKTLIPHEIVSPDVVEDYYNTRFHWKQSNHSQNLVEDFYGAYNRIHPYNFYKPCEYHDQLQISSHRPCVYKNHPNCYPTSSQGHLRMQNKEIDMKNFNTDRYPRTSSRYFNGNTIIVDSDRSTRSTGRKRSRRSQPVKYSLGPVNKDTNLKSSAVQTESKTIIRKEIDNDDTKEETIKQKYERISKNVDRLKKNIGKSQNDVQTQSLTNIENRLNDLIRSINACLLEMKTNKEFKRKTVCVMAHNVSESTLTFKNAVLSKENLNKACISQLDDILYEELDKSNRAKKDIEDIINRQPGRPCGGQITIDIPTRERATEVTASLSQARFNVDKMVVVEEVNNPETDRMTIAVNTDPLGLLALLKISTETVKRILSYMPQIDYYSYLPMIQFPQCSRHSAVSHYVCNICGLAFGRPSQLSDHIQEHNLGKSR